MALPSSRYTLWAERLVHRDGAVRAALTRRLEEEQAASQPVPAPTPAPHAPVPPHPLIPAGAQVIHLSDAEAAAALTRQGHDRGFPGVAYLK